MLWSLLFPRQGLLLRLGSAPGGATERRAELASALHKSDGAAHGAVLSLAEVREDVHSDGDGVVRHLRKRMKNQMK